MSLKSKAKSQRQRTLSSIPAVRPEAPGARSSGIRDDEARRRYAFIVNTSPDMMALVSRHWIYEAVNDAFCAAHRLQRFAVIGKRIEAIGGLLAAPEVVDAFRQCFRGHSTVQEVWVELEDRGRACLDCSWSPYFDEFGQVTHAVFIARDVTARVDAEAEQRRIGERIQLLQQVSAAANTPLSLEQVIANVLETTGRGGGWLGGVVRPLEPNMLGEIWFFDNDAGVDGAKLEQEVSRIAAARGGCIASETIERAETVFVQTNTLGLEDLYDIGVGHIVTAPIASNGYIVAVLELYGDLPLDPEMLEVVANIAHEIEHVFEREAAAEEILRSRNQYRNLFEAAQDAIFLIDPVHDRIIDVNEQATRQYGREREHLLDYPVATIGVDITWLKAEIETQGHVRFESSHARVDGHELVVEVHASPVEVDGGRALLAISRDITDRVHAERMLEHQALHDGLTGLPNRRMLAQRLTTWFESNMRMSLLFVDLDAFKSVNDSLGIAAGDLILRIISDRLRALVGIHDLVARVGGAEFAVLLAEPPVGNRERARQFAETIRRSFQQAFDVYGREVFVTSSIGVAFSDALSGDSPQPEDLLRDANIATVRAKSFGKGSIEVFDQRMHEDEVNRLELERALRTAVEEKDEIVVFYQPVCETQSEKIVGFEALVRWMRKDGMVSPARFIPLAEETGLIVELGRIVLEKTCLQLAEWRKRYPKLTANVNVSAKQLWRAEFLEHVYQALDKAKLPPEALKLELTESAVMEDPDAVIAKLEELRKAGVSICIDDFGTGFSSLAYLNHFPLDVLKIDRSFVRDAHKSGGHAIIRAIIALATALDLDVVAEGVETEEDCKLLKDFNCSHVQGYYFARPMPANEAIKLVIPATPKLTIPRPPTVKK